MKFPGPGEASEQRHHAHRGQQSNCEGKPKLKILRLAAATQDPGQRPDGYRHQEASHHRHPEPPGLEPGPFVLVGGHHPGQCRVGNVDGGIGGHQQRIGDVGIDEFVSQGHVRGDERRDCEHGIGNGHPKKPGTIPTPSGPRAVCHGPHDRIGDGIEEADDDQEGSCGGSLDAIDVRVEIHQDVDDGLIDDVAGHVAQAVSELFPEAEFLFQYGMVSRWVRPVFKATNTVITEATPKKLFMKRRSSGQRHHLGSGIL